MSESFKRLDFFIFFEINEINECPTQQNFTQNEKSEEEIIFESIDFFVRMMSIMGFPRSVGEIYGLLYFSQQPLSMDKIMDKLRISLGSAVRAEIAEA